MKAALVYAVFALSLSACDKKQAPPPVAPPVPKVQSSAPVPSITMSSDDKANAVDAAKAAAKAAGGGKE